jgi:SAM-dependent methyltransferase
MPDPAGDDFIRYLAAKTTVDDRALNRAVWDAFAGALADMDRPPRVLEVGAGIGTMVERAWAWGLLPDGAAYHAVDARPENIAEARRRIGRGAEAAPGGGFRLSDGERRAVVTFEAADLYDVAARPGERGAWDAVIAHALLDLLNLPAALGALFGLLRPGGAFLFTLVFDGVTAFLPALDPALDAQIEAAYHRTMDARTDQGLPTGGSRAGRRLLAHLSASDARLLAAGGSDWVVHPGPAGYPADEAIFLEYIIRTVHRALRGEPGVAPARLDAWVAARREQIADAELIYIAHQLDFAGLAPG